MTDKEKEKEKQQTAEPRPWTDADVDEAELESFPASDPPAYTTGIERPAHNAPPPGAGP